MADIGEKIGQTMYMWLIFPIIWEAFMGVYYSMLPNYPEAIWGIAGMWIIRIGLWIGGVFSVIKWIYKIYDFIE